MLHSNISAKYQLEGWFHLYAVHIYISLSFWEQCALDIETRKCGFWHWAISILLHTFHFLFERNLMENNNIISRESSRTCNTGEIYFLHIRYFIFLFNRQKWFSSNQIWYSLVRYLFSLERADDIMQKVRQKMNLYHWILFALIELFHR